MSDPYAERVRSRSTSPTTILSDRSTPEREWSPEPPLRSLEGSKDYKLWRSPPRKVTKYFGSSFKTSSDEIWTPPFDPWKDSGSVVVPGYDLVPRNFKAGYVQTLGEFIRSNEGNAFEIQQWLKVVRDLHWDYRVRHGDAMWVVHDMERLMRRLESPVEDWLRLGLDKIAPMPEVLKRYCRGEGK